MFLLKMIYKPIVLVVFLFFNFIYGLASLLAKLGAIFWIMFLWLVIAILVYTGLHQQWIQFSIVLCIGFMSYIGASAIMGLGFIADWLNDKLIGILTT